MNLWEFRQKILQLDATPDWQIETNDLLDKVRGLQDVILECR